NSSHLRRQVRLGKLSGGDVHAHGQRRVARKLNVPCTKLQAGFAQQPAVSGEDDSGLLSNLDEMSRGQEAFRPLPSTECLEPGNLSALQRHDGLIVNAELAQ